MEAGRISLLGVRVCKIAQDQTGWVTESNFPPNHWIMLISMENFRRGMIEVRKQKHLPRRRENRLLVFDSAGFGGMAIEWTPDRQAEGTPLRRWLQILIPLKHEPRMTLKCLFVLHYLLVRSCYRLAGQPDSNRGILTIHGPNRSATTTSPRSAIKRYLLTMDI